MSKLFELEGQLKGALAQAEGLVKLAKEEGREFTPDERKQIDAHLAAAEDLKDEIRRLRLNPIEERLAEKERDEALHKALNDLLKGVEETEERNDGSGAKGGRVTWGKTFLDALPYQPVSGRKDLLSPAGSVTVASMLSTIGTLSDVGRAETILQFIPGESITEDNVSYLYETVREHAAAPVAIGEAKPESVYTLARKNEEVRTIAHLTEPISRNWLADAPKLRSYIDGVLREGLILELEYQIIQGSGAGEDFLGMLNWAGILLQAFDTNVIRTCRRAITALEVYNINPTGFAFHPTDWETIELSYAQGIYQMTSGDVRPPVDRARRRLWGLPVALSTGCPEGTGILADWPAATYLWEREGARIDWSESVCIPSTEYDSRKTHFSGFETNQVIFRGELRAVFGVPRARGIVEIALEAGS